MCAASFFRKCAVAEKGSLNEYFLQALDAVKFALQAFPRRSLNGNLSSHVVVKFPFRQRRAPRI